MKKTRLVAPTLIAGMLAIPAAAFGQGSVYTDTARIDTNPAPGQVTLVNQVRHLVTNHGFTYVLRETNGASTQGMVDYSRLPGDYRSGLTTDQILSEGDTGAQPHATCRGVAALETEAAITGWQGDDPFYNYIPFQKASAGLADNPADWIGDVQALTGADLSQVSDDPATAAGQLQARCTNVGGTFVPADQIQTAAASLASGTLEAATTPLEASIAQLEAAKAAAEQAAATAQGQAATAQAQNALLQSELGQMKAAAKPLDIAVRGRQTMKQLAARGATVDVSGPSGRAVTVRAIVSVAKAKALGLRSTTLGRGKATIGNAGNAVAKVTLSGRAKRAVSDLDGSLRVTFEGLAGDRFASQGKRFSG